MAHAATSRSRRTRGCSHSTTLASARPCAPCCALALSVFLGRTSTFANSSALCPNRSHLLPRGWVYGKTCQVVQVKEQYLACLKEHANQAEACRELAKTYLECRMARCDWVLHSNIESNSARGSQALCWRTAERLCQAHWLCRDVACRDSQAISFCVGRRLSHLYTLWAKKCLRLSGT